RSPFNRFHTETPRCRQGSRRRVGLWDGTQSEGGGPGTRETRKAADDREASAIRWRDRRNEVVPRHEALTERLPGAPDESGVIQPHPLRGSDEGYREFARRVGRHRLGEDEFRSRLRVDEEILMGKSAAVLCESEAKV